MNADVIVVGAGPAGAAAACFLAREGWEVVLVDRGRFPREKPCGEGVLPAGVGVLERLGAMPALLRAGARTFRGIRYHAPGGRTAVGRFPGGATGVGVRRRVLDAVLLGAARSHARVRVEEGFEVRELLRDARGAVAGVGDGARTIGARLVVAADGAGSRVRRLAGLDGRRTTRWGLRQHFRPIPAPSPEPLVDVYVTGAAEAYVTPVAPGEYGVAWLAGDGAPRDVRGERAIRGTLRGRKGIAAALAEAPASSEPMAAAGMGSVARDAVADGLVLLGDAAGAPDPITGMGVSFALRCAEGLPHAVHRALHARAVTREALAPYRRLRRSEVEGGFVVTRAVMWLASRRARAELAVRALNAAPPLFPALLRLAAG